MDPTDRALLAKIDAAESDLDAWRERLRTLVGGQPRSSVAADDRILATWPLSQVAIGGLGAAVHHLIAIRLLLSTRHLFPSVYGGLARAALVGASQALWVLAPSSRTVRQGNALVLIRDEMKHLSAHYDKVSSQYTQPAGAPSRAQLDQMLTDRRGQVSSALASLNRTDPLNTTNIVEYAIQAARLSTERALLARSTWMAGSGAAHGRSWQLLAEFTPPTLTSAPGQMAEFQAGGDLGIITGQFLSAYELTSAAWRIWDQRSVP